MKHLEKVSLALGSPSTILQILQLPQSASGRPANIIARCRNDLTLSRLSGLRIRLLLHATTLRYHTSRFRPSSDDDRSPICPLCSMDVPEDPLHFVAVCPALLPIRQIWIPKIYGSTPPTPPTICDHVLGIQWHCSQNHILRYLADLYKFRAIVISSPQVQYSP